MQNKPIRVGTFTLGATLAGVGVALLAHNLGPERPGFELWRLWPLLPLLLGAEYLVRQLLLERQSGEPKLLRLDGLSLFLSIFILLAGMAYTAIPLSWSSVQSVVGLWRPYEYRTEVRQELTDLTDVRRLIVSHQQGDVVLEGSDDSRIVVTATVHTWAPSPEAAEELARSVGVALTPGPDVHLDVKQPSLQTGASRWTVDYTIQLPKTLPVRAEVALGSLRADNVTAALLTCRNGVLDVGNLHGPAVLVGRSGPITLRGASDTVSIDAENSNVSVQDVQGRLRVTNSGSVTVMDPAGPLEVRASQGGVRVTSAQPPAGDWLLTSLLGPIEVQLPANSSVSLAGLARAGDIMAPDWAQVNRTATESTASGTLGQGQYKLRLQTDRGQIRILTD